MPSNYDQIRKDNLTEYGEGKRHLEFLNRLYTDRTHFIFELLQNAEDARASKILFELLEDRLEVRHDGRPFDEQDVRGVCGVGEGTKAEDLTQIGKFGIGFKSVYAYTATPEIHSGEEHFRIEHYIRPYSASVIEPGNSWTTLFILPFDSRKVEATVASQEIAQRLQGLSARTLLFLRSIEEIEYKLPDDSDGIYLRQEDRRNQMRQVKVIGQGNGTEEDEVWLLFERLIPTPNGAASVPVELGFKLERSPGEQIERVVKIGNSPLNVYFPTEKSTGFGFLMQGPYRTTPARDNIPRDDGWNTTLVRETATLLTEALRHLKEAGLLTVSLLEALPLKTSRRPDDFPKHGLFYPIVEAVNGALKEEELFPAQDGTFVSVRNAKIASSTALRELLPHNHLRTLLQRDEIKWLSGQITESQTPDLYTFVRENGIEAVVDPERFARYISEKFLNSLDDKDTWFVRFYEFLLNQESLWRAPRPYYPYDPPGMLRNKPIIRLANGDLVAPFDASDKPNAYLPESKSQVSHDEEDDPDNLSQSRVATSTKSSLKFPLVKRTIADSPRAREFLKQLGLTEPDEVAEVLNHILPKYSGNPVNEIEEEEYQSDLRAIFSVLAAGSPQTQGLKEVLKTTRWIRAINAASGERTLKAPNETCLPAPEISVFFQDNPDAWFVNVIIPAEHYNFLAELGSRKEVNPQFRHPDWPGRNEYVTLQDERGGHQRGLDRFDPNATLEGLEFALSHPKLERSRLIWNGVLVRYSHLVHGIVEESTRKDYLGSEKKPKYSKLGEMVRNYAWVPTKDLQWRHPRDVRRDELHPDLILHEPLLKTLGVMPEQIESEPLSRFSQEEHMSALGIRPDELEVLYFIRRYHDEFVAWQKRKWEAVTPEFPTKKPANDERREKRVAEQFAEAPDKAYEQRDRSVRTTQSSIDPHVWLTDLYTNHAEQLVCQICKEEMPFRKRDGQYYFEAVEALSREYFPKGHEAQYLALCPLCAAMYKEFVKNDNEAQAALVQALNISDEPEIPIQLGELQTSVRFVETHFNDLMTIINRLTPPL